MQLRPTDADVRLTLTALRRGERQAAALPLAPLVLHDGRAGDGANVAAAVDDAAHDRSAHDTATYDAAAERLTILLARITWDSLCRARGMAGAVGTTGTAGAREPATSGAADAAIAADFQSAVPDREAWSALYHRYFGPRIPVGHIAAAAGVDRRTVQRRLELGYRRLAERLTATIATIASARELGDAETIEVAEAVEGAGAASVAHSPRAPAGLGGSLKPFVGRTDALRALAELATRAPLVTITGPGGVGKSRLALEVARRRQRADAGASSVVVWVGLDDVEDDERLPAALARALEPVTGRVPATVEAIGAAIGQRPLVVVIDRAEHVLAAAAAWAEPMLRYCPGLRMIVTSRSPLRIAGEHLFPLEPLDVPQAGVAEPAAVRATDAGALFEARARAVRPTFRIDAANAAAVATICRRLDGLPLAIELAAAQTRRMGVTEIARQLDDRFDVLVDGEVSAPARHRTFHDALAWSIRQLDPDGAAVLARLAVFQGPFDTDDATNVCADRADDDRPPSRGSGGADRGRARSNLDGATIRRTVHALVDRSLVHVAEGPEGTYRYRLLESVRDLVRRLLPDGDRDERLDRLTDDVRTTAAAAAAALDGPEGPRAAARLRAREADVVAAIERLAATGRAEQALAMAADLGDFWLRSGLLATGRRCLELALDGASMGGSGSGSNDVASPAAARAHEALGAIARQQCDYPVARRNLETALAYQTARADRAGMARVLRQLGSAADEEADYARAEAYHREALALYEALGDDWGVAAARNNLGTVATNIGRLDEAEAHLRASLAGFTAQDATWAVGVVHFNLGNAAFDRAAYAQAEAHYRASLAIAADGDDDLGIVAAEIALGNLAERRADRVEARRCYAAAWRRLATIGDLQEVAEWLEAVAHLARGADDPEQAARAYSAASALRTAIGSPIVPKDRVEVETDLAAIRAALGADAFDAAWIEGGRLGWGGVAAEWMAGEELPA